ncbi:MAG TPA: CBS domain-containing protein [Stellaceae bacterium]|nr:CBS domain-containing protein [Stellaceae bacterium]
MHVESILRNKGRKVTTIASEARIATAVAMLRRHAIGALVVSRDGAAVEGILSERDIVIALADHGAAALDLTVRDLMSREVITCRRDDAIADLAALMTERRIRHLPVVDRGTLAGIVSIGDVVKHRIDEVEGEASSMREFIASA